MALQPSDFQLPQTVIKEGKRYISGPSAGSFTSRFGHAFPEPSFISSGIGETAVYDLRALSGKATRRILIIHGLNTPALGMLPLAKEIQALDLGAHVVLFDLWGHGFSSTPLLAHAPHIFHLQILQVLSFMGWTSADIVGFSFGGTTAVSFAIHNPQAARSVNLIAPAGIMPFDGFDEELRSYLLNSEGRSVEAREYLMNWLEGGPLKVPDDWQAQSRAGNIVASALRQWEVDEHAGFAYSVFSMFRDGGVYGCEEDFGKLARTSLAPVLVILGALDNVAAASQMEDLGFKNVKVIGKATHELPRSHKAEIAQHILAFLTESPPGELTTS